MKGFFTLILLSLIFINACSGNGSKSKSGVETIADVGGNPDGVTVTDSGEIYITDIQSGEVIQVTPEGETSIIVEAGNISHPDGITSVTADGGDVILYVAEIGSGDPEGASLPSDGTIRKIDIETGVVTTFVDSTIIDAPTGIAADDSGNLYVADQATGDVYKIPVDESGNAQTPINLTEILPEGVDIESPHGIALVTNDDDSLSIYITDQGENSNNIVKIDITSAADSTVTGIIEVTPDSAGGTETGTTDEARFNKPHGISADKNGAVFVADENNNRIQIITPNGNVVTFAGTGESGDTDGDSEESMFNSPRGLAVDNEGDLLVCDYGNSKVKKIKD